MEVLVYSPGWVGGEGIRGGDPSTDAWPTGNPLLPAFSSVPDELT